MPADLQTDAERDAATQQARNRRLAEECGALQVLEVLEGLRSGLVCFVFWIFGFWIFVLFCSFFVLFVFLFRSTHTRLFCLLVFVVLLPLFVSSRVFFPKRTSQQARVQESAAAAARYEATRARLGT